MKSLKTLIGEIVDRANSIHVTSPRRTTKVGELIKKLSPEERELLYGATSADFDDRIDACPTCYKDNETV